MGQAKQIRSMTEIKARHVEFLRSSLAALVAALSAYSQASTRGRTASELVVIAGTCAYLKRPLHL